jgi:hypothetical protein
MPKNIFAHEHGTALHGHGADPKLFSVGKWLTLRDL